VLENDANQSSLLDPITDPPRAKYRAQWNDDFHHVFHTLLTGETSGYYADYREPTLHLARTVAEGFVYQGESSPHRGHTPRGEPTSALPAPAFVNFLQNHDQIGNRARGERLSILAPAVPIEAALTITLLSPGTPLMFMGDEWGAREPFPFFCDFKGELAVAVRDGRRKEFAEAYATDGDRVPDPLSHRTFHLAKLDWNAIKRPEHQARLDLVRRLIAARKLFVTPRLPQLGPGPGQAEFADGVLTARWLFDSGETLAMQANLCGVPRARPGTAEEGLPVWGGAPPARLPPWSVYVAIEGP
jgi:malto-oligosyltrehalose trehalohydrolase